ncbi:hypothetical protein CEXT_700911 [Caerostris extrusa]|uniref:Uncharacterized protein n=1 Tax=Caerostris extrusa TaxID=172846 RepID=A0AAV4XAV1_CAEEX|nr:hypothetical protein CEXT_700911 [Caerostris extrusa]
MSSSGEKYTRSYPFRDRHLENFDTHMGFKKQHVYLVKLNFLLDIRLSRKHSRLLCHAILYTTRHHPRAVVDLKWFPLSLVVPLGAPTATFLIEKHHLNQYKQPSPPPLLAYDCLMVDVSLPTENECLALAPEASLVHLLYEISTVNTLLETYARGAKHFFGARSGERIFELSHHGDAI